jgi:hypothetical protein
MAEILSPEALKAKADALTHSIRVTDPSLTFIYAVHHQGHLQSTLHVMEDLILDHPAGATARSIVNRTPTLTEPSAFQGLSVHNQQSWMAFQNSVSMLAIVSINIDQYSNFDEALLDMYHQTWQGLEMAELCRRPEMMQRLHNRPMIPKRGPLGEARSNMRGDIFSTLMMSAEGRHNAVQKLATQRSQQVLNRSQQHRPENYPFMLVAEAADFAVREIFPNLDHKREIISRCKDITQEISDATTDDQIRQWWRFCEPAQDMAWRGYAAEDILGSALFICEDPYVRAIAHQVITASHRRPTSIDKIGNQYNSFTSINKNAGNHYNLIQETFNIVLAQSVEEDSGKPLLTAANNQNRDLLQGRFLGWCAAALQAAAKSFEQARKQGKSPTQAAQLEFEMLRDGASLESLGKLGQDVIRRQRRGEIMTFDVIQEIAKNLPDMKTVLMSVDMTVKDPAYQNLLNTKHELTHNLEPNGPSHDLAPSIAPAQAPKTPAPVMELSMDIGSLSLPPMTLKPQNTRPIAPTVPREQKATLLDHGKLELAFSLADDPEKPA